jgi:hypothetical protein
LTTTLTSGNDHAKITLAYLSPNFQTAPSQHLTGGEYEDQHSFHRSVLIYDY